MDNDNKWNRDSTQFMRSYYDLAKELDKEDQGEFLMAILEGLFTGKVPEVKSKVAKIALAGQMFTLNSQLEGYENFLKRGKILQSSKPRGGILGGGLGVGLGVALQEEGKEEVKEKKEVKEKVAKAEKPKKPINSNPLLWKSFLEKEGSAFPQNLPHPADATEFAKWIDGQEPGALHHLYPLDDKKYKALLGKYGWTMLKKVSLSLLSFKERDKYKNLGATLENWISKEAMPTVKRVSL